MHYQTIVEADFSGSVKLYFFCSKSIVKTVSFPVFKATNTFLPSGLLKPMDLIYPYRLEMGTKWEVTPKTKNLYAFWDSKLAKALNEELEKEEVLINLASTEYFKAVDLKTLKHRVITPHFKDFKNGELKIVMMYAKHQRGAMARYIIKNKLTNPEELKLYNQDGYSFDVNNSTENDWVFVR